MTSRMTAKLACALAVLLAAAGCSTAPSPAGLPATDLVVGMITSLSGIDLAAGVDARMGAQLAVDEVNRAGGVPGRHAKLLVVDDGGTPAGATDGFRQLLAAGAVGVIGPRSPASVMAVESLAAAHRLPLLSLSGADQVLAGGARPPANLFLAAPSASRSAVRMLQYAEASSLKTVAVVHESGDAFADAGVATLTREAARHGMTIVADEPFDSARVDFDSLVKKLRSAGAEAVLAWGAGGGVALLTRAWGAFGPGPPILLSPASATTAFLRTVGDRGEGALLVTSRSFLLGSATGGIPPAVGGMAREFERRNGYYPSQAAFDGYAAGRLLLRSVAKAGSTAPASVERALAGLSLATAAGDYKYTDQDHIGLPVGAMAIAVVRNGRLAPV